MSLAVACGWTVLRCLVIALLSLPVSWGLQNWLRALSGWQRTVAWAALLLPFFTPDLVVGYAYSNFSLSLIRYPVWNELLFGWLVLVKLVPMGTLALCIWPPGSVSAEALHCYRLALAGGIVLMVLAARK